MRTNLKFKLLPNLMSKWMLWLTECRTAAAAAAAAFILTDGCILEFAHANLVPIPKIPYARTWSKLTHKKHWIQFRDSIISQLTDPNINTTEQIAILNRDLVEKTLHKESIIFVNPIAWGKSLFRLKCSKPLDRFNSTKIL